MQPIQREAVRIHMLMDKNPISSSTSLLDWMDTLIAYVRSGDPDLTNRQMAIVFTVYTRRGPHTVRGLAERLKVSKPVITRALNKLGQLGYLRRQRDEADGRNVFVVRTDKGTEFLDRFERFLGTESDRRDSGFAGRAELREAAVSH